MSVPSSKLDIPVATATAGPPDDPPDVRVGSHGFRVAPNRELNVWMSPDHVGHIGLAEHDGAGRTQTVDGRGIGFGHMVGEGGRAACRPQASDLYGVLDRDRQPVQRPEWSAARGALVSLGRGNEGSAAIEGHDRVDSRVDPLHPGQAQPQQLSAGQLAAPDHLGQLGRRPQAHLIVSHHAPKGVGRRMLRLTSLTRNRQKKPSRLAFCHIRIRPSAGTQITAGRRVRIDRKRARPYDGHGRHRLGSLLAVGATRAFPTPRMCRQRLRRPAPRRPAAPGRRHVAFVAEQPEKRRSETRGDQQMSATLKLTHKAIGAEVRRGAVRCRGRR